MQNVFFRCPPQASTGSEKGASNGIDRGTQPRDRRSTVGRPAMRRATESSQRDSISRSCTRNPSAMPERRAIASAFPQAIGSSERFPEVITSGRPASASRRWWSGVYGSISPTSEVSGATSDAIPDVSFLASSTIGRSVDSSSARSAGETCATDSASSRSRTITAKGFSSRLFRRRRRATASGEVASQARWNPPSPLMATISPATRARAAQRNGSVPSSNSPSAESAWSRGPHSGQALGWAWNRRSAGSSYSARHRAHIGKAAMVVAGRSYGTSRTIVKRGPQFVQLVNAYPYRRFDGSRISARHSPQVARSGGIETSSPSLSRLATITNSPVSSCGIGFHERLRISAAGGGAVRIPWRNVSRAPSVPNASMVTPRESFDTRPFTPLSSASRQIQGRNPTPATVPRTSMCRPSDVTVWLPHGSVSSFPPGLGPTVGPQPAGDMVQLHHRHRSATRPPAPANADSFASGRLAAAGRCFSRRDLNHERSPRETPPIPERPAPSRRPRTLARGRSPDDRQLFPAPLEDHRGFSVALDAFRARPARRPDRIGQRFDGGGRARDRWLARLAVDAVRRRRPGAAPAPRRGNRHGDVPRRRLRAVRLLRGVLDVELCRTTGLLRPISLGSDGAGRRALRAASLRTRNDRRTPGLVLSGDRGLHDR